MANQPNFCLATYCEVHDSHQTLLELLHDAQAENLTCGVIAVLRKAVDDLGPYLQEAKAYLTPEQLAALDAD